MWINIRREPLPPVAVLRKALIFASVNPQGYVTDLVSQGFFLRSVVLSPAADTLLNPQALTVGGSFMSMEKHGYFSYAQVGVEDYLQMLNGALEQAPDSSRASSAQGGFESRSTQD